MALLPARHRWALVCRIAGEVVGSETVMMNDTWKGEGRDQRKSIDNDSHVRLLDVDLDMFWSGERDLLITSGDNTLSVSVEPLYAYATNMSGQVRILYALLVLWLGVSKSNLKLVTSCFLICRRSQLPPSWAAGAIGGFAELLNILSLGVYVPGAFFTFSKVVGGLLQ